MSAHAFNDKTGPVLVEAEATGPAGSANLKLVLDTGATTSLINLSTLLYLGFDPSQSLQHVRLTTGSTVEVVPIIVLTRLSTLGRHRLGFRSFRTRCRRVPPSTVCSAWTLSGVRC
jgi:hypothetical protein